MVFPLDQAEKKMVAETAPAIEAAEEKNRVITGRKQKLQKQAIDCADPAKRQRLLDEINELNDARASVPPLPQLVTGDATPEHLADKLVEQGGRLAWISEEAGALVDAVGGRYTPGQGNFDVFLQAYDGGTVRVGRVTRGTSYLERPALTIIVTPQTAILDRLGEHPDFRGRGLLARFMFVLPPSLVGTRKYQNRRVDPKAKARYAAVITGILNLPLPRPAEVPQLRLEGEALALWAKNADEIELAQADGGELETIRDWASKHAGRVARIAGLLHLVRYAKSGEPWTVAIEVKTVANAWEIGSYVTEHNLLAFDRIGTDPVVRMAKRLLEWIRRQRLSEFSLRDCHQAHRNVNRPQELTPPLQILQGRGFIRRVPPPEQQGRGRPQSPRFEVNPLTHAHKSQKSQYSVCGQGEVAQGPSMEACEDREEPLADARQGERFDEEGVA
jgi:hypothetical protein